jgi:hypothetical protein
MQQREEQQRQSGRKPRGKAPNDKQELTPTLGTLAPVIESGTLAGGQVLAATERLKHGRRIADLEIKKEPAELPAYAPFIEQMRRRLQTSEGLQAYDLRKSTIEPVFGIIKDALRFRRFSLRMG